MSLVSWVGVLLGLVPSIIALSFIKGIETYRIRTLIVGCILIFISALMLGLMTGFQPMFDVLHQKGSISEANIKKEQTDIGLWLIMFPGIVGAIGANLITSWFQSTSP